MNSLPTAGGVTERVKNESTYLKQLNKATYKVRMFENGKAVPKM